MSDDLLRLGACELARLIRAGKTSARSVVDAHIARIRALNPSLNAVAADRFGEALAEADAADAKLATGAATGPLHGVPFTVKEMISVARMPHTFGCTTRTDRVAVEDATVVQRLRQAGAIPLAVTNTPEWGFWFETSNLIYGRTSNPWNAAHTPGGSSGGEGALVGAGASAFGVGSDIGGSIRMPAAFCGAFCHKPSRGLVPVTGHYPVYANERVPDASPLNPYLTLGPITRSARDLLPLLRIMAGPDAIDPNIDPRLELGDQDVFDWRSRRVLILKRPNIQLAAQASHDVSSAVDRAAAALEARGAQLELMPAEFFREAVDLWLSALRMVDAPSLARLLGGGPAINPALELARALAGRPRFTVPALLFALLQQMDRRSNRRFERRVQDAAALEQAFQELVGDGVLVMPVHPRVAPRHNVPLLRPFDFAYTGIFNVLGVPATVVPAGLNAQRLPVAVQVIGARGADTLTIGAARALEEDLGGWSAPERDL